MTQADTSLVRVRAVEVKEDYVLRVSFTDGTTRDVDLAGELWGPMFEPLRDPHVFRAVRVDPELGTAVWPNGADLDPDVLRGTADSADARSVA